MKRKKAKILRKSNVVISIWLVVVVVVGGIIFISIGDMAVAENNDNSCGSNTDTITKNAQKDFTPHEPIYINGNDDFIVGQNGVVSGSGTEGDPYIIENWDIDAGQQKFTMGIEIENTDVYFIIRNCIIHDGYDPNNFFLNDGIYFYNIINGKIEDCDVYNNWDGVVLSSSLNNQITNCNVYNNAGGLSSYGISLSSSSNNNITSNQIYDNHYGIWFDSSSNNNIIDCTVYNNDAAGITLYDSSNTITNCIIYNNTWGIYLGSSSNNNQITNCDVYNNYYYGIELYSSSNNNITGNQIYDNSGDPYFSGGIYLDASSDNLIYNNYFNNTNNAYSSGGNCWNITKTAGTNIINGSYIGGNYWSDYTGCDIDGDGLGDTGLPYGPGDYLPLTVPNFQPNSPTLVSPGNNTWANDNTPYFDWDFEDPDAGDTQGGFHVQISDTSSFSSPNYEYNATSSSDTFWQFPEGTDYTTISDGTWYWQVKTKDNNGPWGDWSGWRIIKIDTTSPSVIIEYNNSKTHYKDSDIVRIYANFTEAGSGINGSSVKISIEYTGGTYLTPTAMTKTDNIHWYYDLDIPPGSVYDGQFKVNITAKDNTSNPLSPDPTQDGSKYIDNTVPTVIIQYNNTKTYYKAGDKIRIYANFTETGSGIRETPKPQIEIVTAGDGDVLPTDLTKTDNLHWYYDFTIPTGSNEDGSFTVKITGKDNADNLLSPSPTTDNSKSIDNTAPTVTIYVSDILISGTDSGYTFWVNCSFSENMDDTVTPTISFNPDAITSGTLIFAGGVWNANDDWYNASYTIADTDEEQTGVDVSVSGVKDDAGNPQTPDPTSTADLFDVDTVAPYSHDPIYINGNSNFTSANGVASGSGTEADPYIIENCDINASTADSIYIENTDVYFIIRNCVIYNGYIPYSIYNKGIYFYNVTNGKIENCEIYNNRYGIYLEESSNNTITNCAVYNNSEEGVFLRSSSNNNITNCAVYNNLYGIKREDSSNDQIHYCNIYNNTQYGVYGVFASDEVNATYNWWGSADGPSGVGPGSGDAVSGNVLYDPWLTEPWTGDLPPTITVTSPNGGEIFWQGTNDYIYWSSTGSISNVKIELYKSGFYDSTIATNTSNDGSCFWDIPWDLTTSSYYQIKIEDTTDSNIYDYSDNYFSIIELAGYMPPTAAFTYTPSNPTTDDTIQFTDQSEPGDDSIGSWSWNFGDGATTTDQSPTHKYNSAGNYTVTLTVTDSSAYGGSDSISKTIVVGTGGGTNNTVNETGLPPATSSLSYYLHYIIVFAVAIIIIAGLIKFRVPIQTKVTAYWDTAKDVKQFEQKIAELKNEGVYTGDLEQKLAEAKSKLRRSWFRRGG